MSRKGHDKADKDRLDDMLAEQRQAWGRPPRDVKSFPPMPPENMAEALVHAALDEVDDGVLADFARTAYSNPSDETEEQRARSVRSIMQLAGLGFAFVNWQRNREVLRGL